MEKKINDIVQWMIESVEEAGAKGIVLGLSGGIDSAVLAAIAKRAFGDNVLGVIMPIESDPEDEADARLVAERIGLEVTKVDLTKTYQEFVKASFDSDHKLAKANIKPRLRMTTLYYYGQSLNYLVAGGTNLSEFYIGYFTKHGDSGTDLMPLASFVKEDIFEMGRILELPEKIVSKAPAAGLYKGQTDENEMGFTYDELDKTILYGNQGPNYDKIQRMHRVTSHKRRYAKMYNMELEE